MNSQNPLATSPNTKELELLFLLELLKLKDRDFNSIKNLSARRLQNYSKVDNDSIYSSLERGTAILESGAQVDKYIQAFGRKHYLKFFALFDSLPAQVFSGLIDVVDWGSGAGLGVIALNDYLRKKMNREIESGIRSIILIEPSRVALERAGTYTRFLFPESELVPVEKRFEDLTANDFPSSSLGIPRLHLFSNVLDLDVFNDSLVWDKLMRLIKATFCRAEYFLLASPSYNSIEVRFKRMISLLEDDDDVNTEQILKPVEKIFTKSEDGTAAKMTATAVLIQSKKQQEILGAVKHPKLLEMLNLHRDSNLLQRDLVRDLCMQMSPSDCDVLYRPNLMGAIPDIILLKKGFKAKIVYASDAKCLAGMSLVEIMEVAKKAENVKNNIFDFLSGELLCQQLASKTNDLYKVMECVVYISTPCRCDVERQSKIKGKLGSTRLQWQGDIWKWNPCSLMDGAIYDDLKNITTPKRHSTNKLSEIILDPKQREYAFSMANENKKIFGVFGSGKSTLLVARAISARKRTHATVLILTYNITLRSYIEELLLQMFGNFSRNDFYVVNYHEFIKGELQYAGIQSRDIKFDDADFFKTNASNFKRKYDSIFVDETQDYEYQWLVIIKSTFLAERGEYVLFGDEKQNVYDQPIEQKRIKTNISGQEVRLKTCHRAHNDLIQKIGMLQRSLFQLKYDLDEFDEVQEELGLVGRVGRVGVVDLANYSLSALVSLICRISEDYKYPTILSYTAKFLRMIEKQYRDRTRLETETMFLREEDDAALRNSRTRETLERGMKLHFNSSRNVMKFCTVHSYKGFEAETIIMVITLLSKKAEEELIYTALTRSRANLFIINCGKTRYGERLQKIFGRLNV